MSQRPAHCKGCILWHRAGHPKGSQNEKYNSWCCNFGKPAKDAEAHCRNVGGKKEAS